MDLPTCPACGQSVLDDDVDECPFCGASMSGAPVPVTQSAATPPRATATDKTTDIASPTPVKQTPSRTEPEPTPASDDPFELERSSASKKKVVHLRTLPEPGRRHEVTCPMCETVGYTARKAAGMDVRCANPDCNLPLFVAPPLSDDAEQEHDAAGRKSELPVKKILIGTVIVIAVGALAVWLWQDPKDPDSSAISPTGRIAGPGKTIPPKNKDKNGKVVKKSIVKPDVRKQLLALRTNALTVMVTHSGVTPQSSVVKPFAWQFTIIALAHAGETKSATEHLNQLRTVTVSSRFLRTLPLVATAWNHLEHNTPEEQKKANAALDEAVAASGKLFLREASQRNPEFYDIATGLSALLYAAGKRQQAEKLIEDHSQTAVSARKSLFQRQVRYLHAFDAEAAWQKRSLHFPASRQRPVSPQRVAVTIILAGHGRWTQALAWAKSQTSASIRDECLIAWAEYRAGMTVRDKSISSWDVVSAQLSNSSARARLFARVAGRLQERGNPAEATVVLKQARAVLKNSAAGSEPKTPGIKEVFSYSTVSDEQRATRRESAFAFAELARAELRVDPTNAATAWTALSRGLAIARSSAPSPVAVARMVAETKTPYDRAVRSELSRIFAISANDAIDKKFKQYLLKLGPISAASNERFTVEDRMLSAAAHWGRYWNSPQLLQRIWNEVDARSKAGSTPGREDWYNTRLPWLLAVYAQEADRSQLATAIRMKIKESKSRPTSIQQAWADVRNAIAEKRYAAAAAVLSHRRIDPDWVNTRVFVTGCSLVNSGELDAAARFAVAFRDPYLRMEALNLVAARATVLGRQKAVWELSRNQALNAPQKVAICSGLVFGMTIPPKPPRKTRKSSVD